MEKLEYTTPSYADVYIIHAMLQDPEQIKFTNWDVSESLNDTVEFITERNILAVKDAGDFIGFVYMYDTINESEDYECQTGRFLLKSHRGKGYGSKIHRDLYDMIKAKGKTVVSTVDIFNIASQKSIEKNGLLKKTTEIRVRERESDGKISYYFVYCG